MFPGSVRHSIAFMSVRAAANTFVYIRKRHSYNGVSVELVCMLLPPPPRLASNYLFGNKAAMPVFQVTQVPSFLLADHSLFVLLLRKESAADPLCFAASSSDMAACAVHNLNNCLRQPDFCVPMIAENSGISLWGGANQTC